MMKNEEETIEARERPPERPPEERPRERSDSSFMLPLLGAGLLAVPSWFAWQWIQAFLHGESREERMTLFMTVFPGAMQHPKGVVTFVLVFAAAALLLGLAGRFLCRGFGRLASGIVIVGAVVVAVGLTLSLV